MAALLAFTETVAQAHDLKTVYAAAVAALSRALRSTAGTLLVRDAEGAIRVEAVDGALDHGAALDGVVFWDGPRPAPIVVPDTDGRAWATGRAGHAPRPPLPRERLRAAGIRALLAVPVTHDARPGPSALVVSDARPRQFSADDLRVAQIVAAEVATALERRQATDGLARYREIFVNANEGIGILDPDGLYLEQNDAHRALLGYSDDDLRGATPAIHLGGPTFRTVSDALARSGQFRGEVTSRDKSGRPLSLQLSAFAVRDEHGAPTCFVGIKRDIGTQKRAERRFRFLAEIGAILGSTLDYQTSLKRVVRLSVPELADWCTIELRPHGSTPADVAVAHVDPSREAQLEELLRRRAQTHTATDSADPGISRLIRRINPSEAHRRAGSELERAELDLLTPCSLIIVPLATRGQTLGTLTLGASESGRTFDTADLTLAQELAQRTAVAIEAAHLFQRAQEASEMKDQFLATLSHELRSPLNAMLGWVRLLRTGRLEPERQAHALQTIERNAQAQAKLIEDLLDLSRIVTGKLRLELKLVDLGTALTRTVESWRPIADARSVHLEPTIVDPGVLVRGDPDRLEQVISNLLSNAIKFSDPGGSVQLTLRRAGGQAEIQVTDHGRGISTEFLPFVFDRFRQADSSARRAAGGLGLGLAIARHLVDQHQGQIQAASAGPGQGATFTMTLPILPVAADPEALAIERPPMAGSGSLDGVRVLVVDDEADARELLQTLLEQCGATVVTAESSRAALDGLESRPQIVISDISMPGEDGLTFVRKMRQDERWVGVPAVALTGFASVEDRHRALAAGFDAHLAKPVEPDELVAAIRALVGAGAPQLSPRT